MLARTPLLGGHPAVIQLPFDRLVELVGERFEIVVRLPGADRPLDDPVRRRWPTALTPARGTCVVGHKAG